MECQKGHKERVKVPDVLPAAREPTRAHTFRIPAKTDIWVSFTLRSSFMNIIAPLITPVSEKQEKNNNNKTYGLFGYGF